MATSKKTSRKKLAPGVREPVATKDYEITKTLPKKLKDQLSSPEAIAHMLESI